uniref:Uncharacterized protein n=1 Tax=Anguilla anguilla TaxID=7936 RepID=A0A0E9SP37_ANGAN
MLMLRQQKPITRDMFMFKRQKITTVTIAKLSIS